MSARPLSLADPETVRALVELQRAAYRVEADLIGTDAIPPLTESEEVLAASGETFLGIEEDGGMVAAVSYKREDDLVDIHRLVVHPRAFRRGLATRLLDALERRERDARRWEVSTGAANAPARALYERRGFALSGEADAGPVRIARYERRTPAPWVGVTLAAFALALLSLLLPSEPTYDPWAWIIWAREVTEGTLNTTVGPSWKPLPVLLTAPFALLGDDVAPAAWLVIARAGGLLAVVMAYRLGRRLAGPVAGVLAGAFLFVADEFLRNFARGNSEGLLVALVLFAIERHLDGRRVPAFLLGFGAALLRPEVWPFLGLYGLWLAWRADGRTRLLVAAAFAALVALWLGPEWWGSGNPLRASDRARQPNPDSPAFADHPFLEVFRRSWHVLMPPVLAGAAIGLAVAARRREQLRHARLRLAFGAGAAVLMLMVAAMTEAGYAGNLRYVALPAALVCALAGAGFVDLVKGASARFGRRAAIGAAVAAAAVALPFTVHEVGTFAEDARLTGKEAALYEDLDRAVAAFGGPGAVRRCGAVTTGRFDTMALAWRLHVPLDEIGLIPVDPGVAFATREFSLTRPMPSPLSLDPRYPVVARTAEWVVRARCAS